MIENNSNNNLIRSPQHLQHQLINAMLSNNQPSSNSKNHKGVSDFLRSGNNTIKESFGGGCSGIPMVSGHAFTERTLDYQN
jgi:hypothetical protein